MAFSSLASAIYPVSNYSNGAYYGRKITHFTFHHMAGNLSNQSCASILNSRGVSANYGIDVDGNIAGFVDEINIPWSDGNWASNLSTVSVELADDNAAYHVSDKTIEAGCKLCADVLKRAGLPATAETIRYHRQYAATSCPGDYVVSIFPNIIARVQQILAGADTSQPVSATPTTPSAPASPSKGKLIAMSQQGYWRKAPSTSAEAVGLFNAGAKFTCTEIVNGEDPYGTSQGRWVKNISGFYAWEGLFESSDLVALSTNGAVTSTPAPRTPFAVKGIATNIWRRGPGTNYAAVSQYGAGATITCIDKVEGQDPYGDGRNKWYKSQLSGLYCWEGTVSA